MGWLFLSLEEIFEIVMSKIEAIWADLWNSHVYNWSLWFHQRLYSWLLVKTVCSARKYNSYILYGKVRVFVPSLLLRQIEPCGTRGPPRPRPLPQSRPRLFFGPPFRSPRTCRKKGPSRTRFPIRWWRWLKHSLTLDSGHSWNIAPLVLTIGVGESREKGRDWGRFSF